MPHVEELPLTGPSSLVRPQPGWALIPDSTYIDPSKAPLNPAPTVRGKRSTRYDQSARVSGDAITARQKRATERRLEVLTSENKWDRKDVHIPIPKKAGDDKAGRKQTTGVRKILQSERTFKHHLEQEDSELEQQARQGGSSTSLTTPQIAPSYAIPQSPHPKKKKTNSGSAQAAESESVPSSANTTNASEFDTNPLLATSVAPLPSRDELLRLITAPPLSYNAARARPPSAGTPMRRFCEICGYWERSRCLKCGASACGLEHSREHETQCAA